MSFEAATVIDKGTIDEIIESAIYEINEAMVDDEDKPYAELGELEGSHVTVTILNGNVNVSRVYTDIVQILLDVLKENLNIVTSIHTGEGEDANVLYLSEEITMEDIKAFVKASGLEGSGENGEIMGYDTIDCLDGQSMSATVTDVNGKTYTYTVSFEAATEQL